VNARPAFDNSSAVRIERRSDAFVSLSSHPRHYLLRPSGGESWNAGAKGNMAGSSATNHFLRRRPHTADRYTLSSARITCLATGQTLLYGAGTKSRWCAVPASTSTPLTRSGPATTGTQLDNDVIGGAEGNLGGMECWFG